MTNKFNQFDIPNLYYFIAKNYFTGSRKNFNFKIDSDGSEMKVSTWHGFICSELAEFENSNTFPVTQEGHQAMLDWLEECYQNQKSPE